MEEDLEYWIYHERQEAALCGQHALNNLVQECAFSPNSLANIAVSNDVSGKNRGTPFNNVSVSHDYYYYYYYYYYPLSRCTWTKWNWRTWLRIVKVESSTYLAHEMK